MISKYVFLSIILSFALKSELFAKDTNTMTSKWFEITNPTTLSITKSKLGVNKPILTLKEISDPLYIQRLVSTISALPIDADEKMKSFEDNVELWSLNFCNDEHKCQTIEFYREMIKTPNTGFFASSPKEEKKLAEEIRNLLQPKLGVPLPIISGYTIPFKDFSVEFLGTEVSPSAPVTRSTSTDKFRIVPAKGEAIELEITSGQLSPKPMKFKVGKTSYTLLRHKLKDVLLYKNYFAITK